MQFYQFKRHIREQTLKADIKTQLSVYGRQIIESSDGAILIDGIISEYESINQAIDQLKHEKITDDIRLQLHQETYSNMVNGEVLDIIRRHGIDRVTDTLIESYIELASSKIFTTDPIAQNIRQLNTLGYIIENRLDYILDDGTKIVIDECTQNLINTTLGQHQDIIEYMRSSADTFFTVLKQIKG